MTLVGRLTLAAEEHTYLTGPGEGVRDSVNGGKFVRLPGRVLLGKSLSGDLHFLSKMGSKTVC